MSDTYKQVDTRNRRKGTGKNLKEHRVVVETIIGKKLPSSVLVHHKDRNKRNNDPLNLEPISRSEHAKLHWRERIQEDGRMCLVKDCCTITIASHRLCHFHSTIQGMWARNRGHETGWSLEEWLSSYRPRIFRPCLVTSCGRSTASTSGLCRTHHNRKDLTY